MEHEPKVHLFIQELNKYVKQTARGVLNGFRAVRTSENEYMIASDVIAEVEKVPGKKGFANSVVSFFRNNIVNTGSIVFFLRIQNNTLILDIDSSYRTISPPSEKHLLGYDALNSTILLNLEKLQEITHKLFEKNTIFRAAFNYTRSDVARKKMIIFAQRIIDKMPPPYNNMKSSSIGGSELKATYSKGNGETTMTLSLGNVHGSPAESLDPTKQTVIIIRTIDKNRDNPLHDYIKQNVSSIKSEAELLFKRSNNYTTIIINAM